MKMLFIFLITLINLSAKAAIIPDGGYQGRLAGDEKGTVHLLIQANSGCEGCFTAVALDTPDFDSPTVRMAAYTGMPWDSTFKKFSLTPINVDTDGELSHPNDNPSLMLDIVANPGSQNVSFVITPSGSDNTLGFTGSMTFTHSHKSPFHISTAKNGEYRYAYERKTNAVISSVEKNKEDQANEVSLQWFGNIRQKGGNFNLKEKFPGVFSFNSVIFSATGKSIAERPNYIVIFAKKRQQDYVLMVNPIDSRDVLCLILK